MANPYDKFDPTSDVKDVALSFGVGANQLLKMAGDAYGLTTGDMDNVVSKQARENIEYLQRGKSEKLKAAEARRKQATDAEEDTLNKAFTYVRETFTDPRLFLSSTAETTPSMVGAGGIGAGARVATGKLLAKKSAETATKVGVGTAVGAGAGMQGVSTGADQYQQVVETLQSMPEEQAMQVPQITRLMQEKGATLDEAKTALALDLARSTGLLSAVASVGTQMVPGGRTIEKTLVGGAGRKGAGMALAKRGAGAAVGALGEGVQEAAEEGSGQFATNILARAVEPERELTKGVGEAMGAGFAGAAPLGAAAGAASRPSQSVSEGTQTAGMSDESPASAAISPSLEERPTVDLSKAEDLSQDQFFAAINVRQANLLGGEPNPEDVKIVGEITSRAQVDPEKANAAISAAQEAVSAWSENNENAPANIRVIYDPGMAQNGYGIRGAFNRRTGEILINAAYATSPEIVEEVARHEWAHQTLASPDGQKAIVDFAAQAIPAEELADLSRRYGTEDKMVLVDEWIANNAEKAPGVIARIVQYIREWLSEFTNGAVKLSPQEAANVLLRTLREQQTGRVEAETVREEGTRMSLEKAPVAERRQEAFENFKAANPRSDAVMEGGRLYSPAVRNRLKNLLSTGEIDRRALDREVGRNIPAARGVEIPTEENLPSLEEIRAAVDQSQRSKVGGASNIPAGDSVTVRQDVPAFSRYGVGVVTVQDSKGNKYYQPFVRFTEPVLEPTPGMEKASLKIGAGEAKTPTIVARGKMSEDQSLPADLDTWTQVGYNPDRHSYMYDRETGRPVTGGSEAVQIGNTVFVKDPEFGEKGDFLYSLAQTKTPEFKKWFGDSKVVEPDGTPTVMYHGTFFKPRETYLGGRTGDFTVFRPEVQQNFMGEKGVGEPGVIFVSPSPEFATSFAGGEQAYYTPEARDQFAERRPGARVYPLFVKAENPFDYENPEHREKLFKGKEFITVDDGGGYTKQVYETSVEQGRWPYVEPLAGRIKALGFDGFYVNEESTKNLAVFSPDQLKSATGNVGAFGQRPLTAEERERVGVTEEAAEGLQRAGDIRFSLEKEQTPELTSSARILTRTQDEPEKSDQPASKSRFYVASDERGRDFADAIARAAKDHPRGAAVEVKQAEFYSDPKNLLFFAPDGLAGAAVKPDGDLVSVFKHPTSKTRMKELLADASEKAIKLDAFDIDSYLPQLYSNFGFRPVARVAFNDEYAPPRWDFEDMGRPDVVLMVKDKNNVLGLPDSSRYTNEVREQVPLVSYDEAVRLQQEAIDNLKQTGDLQFSLENERTVEDQMKAMTTVKGPLKADSEGFIPEYITSEEALPTVVAGKNKTISVPFVSYNQYANTYFKSKSKDPNYSGKTVSLAEAHAPVIQSSYSGLSAETYLEKDPIKAADMIVNDMAENLLFLHDLATEVFGADVAKRMSKWYDGARVIAEDLAKKYNVSVSQSAAVLACLSPQKHWFANVSLAENVMDVLKNHQETVFDADVEKAARKSIKASKGTQKSKRVLYGIVRDVAGKKLSELSDPDQIAFFTRFLSQYIHPSQAYVVTPEGRLTPGSSVAVAWSGLGVTKNAVAAFLDGSVENLTAALGGGHKVRNFYGNIRDPNSPLFYTSDTHNVAAALLLPVGGSAFEVAHNFGTNAGKSEGAEDSGEEVKGPKLPVVGTTITGLQGTYAMYVEAGRRAAEQRGILPRQMQSITWETVRILFPDDTKTSELMAEIKGIHAKVKAGEITLADARNEIVERMGGKEGIKARPPEWLNQ